MSRYILRRMLLSVVVIFTVMAIVFVIARLSGDPAALMSQPGETREQIEQRRRNLGLDRPIPIQFIRFVAGATQGDFGESPWQKRPAMDVVLDHVPYTLQLATAALALSLIIAVPVGVLAAVKRGTWIDHGVITLTLIGQAIPSFWLGLMMILVLSVTLHWLPTSGSGSLQHLIMPAVSLAAFSTARTARLVRSGMLEVLSQDYVRTARAKGLAESVVIRRHALRNALIPVVTVVGFEFGYLLGGSVIVETIFSWPGVGRVIVQAIFFRDYAIVQASVFLIAVTFVTLNLVVDLIYSVLDPRIRYT